MHHWLIDNAGGVWHCQNHPISRWGADGGPVAFAVTDLGFFDLRLAGGDLRVTFNPSRVSDTAMIQAFFAIVDARPRRTVLLHGPEPRQPEIIGSAPAAIRQIEDLVTTAPSLQPTLMARRLPLERPHRDSRTRVDCLLHAWTDAGGVWSAERFARVFAGGLLDDTALIRNPRGGDRLMIEHWGSRRDHLGPRWSRLAPGRDVEEQPLPTIGALLAAAYRRIQRNGGPHLHDVDTTLPTADGRADHRRYDRLMLPWRAAGGDVYLTSTIFFPRSNAARPGLRQPSSQRLGSQQPAFQYPGAA